MRVSGSENQSVVLVVESPGQIPKEFVFALADPVTQKYYLSAASGAMKLPYMLLDAITYVRLRISGCCLATSYEI